MKQLVLIISFCLATLLVVIAGVWALGYRSEPAHGTVLATVDGITIHHHRSGQDIRGDFGLQFECVEFVNRWLYAHGHRNLTRSGHALSYFAKAEEKGLQPFKNGGSEPPKKGDVIVFSSSAQKYGHVGIIWEVTADKVVITQQNAGQWLTPWLVKPAPFQEFRLEQKGKKYHIKSKRTLSCIGWSRPR